MSARPRPGGHSGHRCESSLRGPLAESRRGQIRACGTGLSGCCAGARPACPFPGPRGMPTDTRGPTGGSARGAPTRTVRSRAARHYATPDRPPCFAAPRAVTSCRDHSPAKGPARPVLLRRRPGAQTGVRHRRAARPPSRPRPGPRCCGRGRRTGGRLPRRHRGERCRCRARVGCAHSHRHRVRPRRARCRRPRAPPGGADLRPHARRRRRPDRDHRHRRRLHRRPRCPAPARRAASTGRVRRRRAPVAERVVGTATRSESSPGDWSTPQGCTPLSRGCCSAWSSPPVQPPLAWRTRCKRCRQGSQCRSSRSSPRVSPSTVGRRRSTRSVSLSRAGSCSARPSAFSARPTSPPDFPVPGSVPPCAGATSLPSPH